MQTLVVFVMAFMCGMIGSLLGKVFEIVVVYYILKIRPVSEWYYETVWKSDVDYAQWLEDKFNG